MTLYDPEAFARLRSDLAVVRYLVFDFDGVLTENGVWVREDGVELVRCSRLDGMGITLLRQSGLPMAVLSKERNPVVAARCRKLEIECRQGVDEKVPALEAMAAELGVALHDTAYVGNDVNDAGCLGAVGMPVVVADAHPSVLPLARYVTRLPGGHGAVREFADMLLEAKT